jgi:hypothetical protein
VKPEFYRGEIRRKVVTTMAQKPNVFLDAMS